MPFNQTQVFSQAFQEKKCIKEKGSITQLSLCLLI